MLIIIQQINMLLIIRTKLFQKEIEKIKVKI